MNPFAAVAVKTVSSAGAAALLSLGLAGGLAQAASPNPAPTPSATTTAPATDRHGDRRAIARAVLESEANVLGIAPNTLRDDLKKGQKVSDLARDKGMTKEQFEAKLIVNVKPRLAALVDHKLSTQPQADRVIDRISKGYVPFWDGLRHRAK